MCACDEFHYNNSFAKLSIRDDLNFLYIFIFNIDSRNANKGIITKLIKASIETIPSNWKIVIVDNENPFYWRYIKSLYPNIRFEEVDSEEVIEQSLGGGEY